MGVVIRDWKGSLKLTAWRILSHCRDAEEDEAVACLEGVQCSHGDEMAQYALNEARTEPVVLVEYHGL